MDKVKIKTPQGEVGVIVARFQTDELTDGHKSLLDFVQKNHQKVIIFLGLSPLVTTINNPLDFQARKQMIEEQYPDIIVGYIKDINNDEVWSKNLDNNIRDIAQNQTVVLYGSRDSFIPHYKGKFQTVELEASLNISGTEIRRRIKSNTRPNKDFRAGVIWAAYNRFDTVYSCVDVAIYNDDGQLLMSRKPFESKWRFIGGFADIDSDSDEQDVKREVQEEAHVEIDDIEYICSKKIKDWRYANERDCIRTRFFKAKYVYGKPTPDDDIEELKWFNVDELNDGMLVDSHRVLFDRLLDKL